MEGEVACLISLPGYNPLWGGLGSVDGSDVRPG